MNNLVQLQGLNKAYPRFSLTEVSFNVPSGSIVGFVGQNGAGKTTTIKAILDVVRKDSGEILIFGKDSHAEAKEIHKGIGVVFEDLSFHDWLRAPQVEKILQGIYEGWDSAYFWQLMDRFGLAGLTGRKDTLKTYSRGMKMKLSLAAALAHRPKLLVMDEATSGLDPVVRNDILDILLEFVQDEERGVLFSSHITSDIEKVADYVVFIHEGKIILNQEKDRLLEEYGVLHCSREAYDKLDKAAVVGIRKNEYGIDVLVNNRAACRPGEGVLVDPASVDDVILFSIRGERQ